MWRNARHRIKKLVEHRYFEWVILVIIVASSVTLVRFPGKRLEILLGISKGHRERLFELETCL